MSTSIAEFWELLERSKLVAQEHCRQLAERFGEQKGAASQTNAIGLAEWLVSQQALSRYQAKILLNGKIGPFFFGDYVLYDKLPAGRWNGSYRALHVPTRHPVMLSLLTGPAVEDPRQMSAAAKQVAAAAPLMGHPYLGATYQLLLDGKRSFVVLEDLAGDTLEQILTKQKRLSPQDVCRIGRELLIGLAALHQTGAVHGAIRPANIVINPANGGVKLPPPPLSRDFWPVPGTVDLSPYSGEQIALQADYLAPELGRAGQTANPQTDIYAVGCVCFQAVTGYPPFAGGDIHTKLMRHASEPVQPLEPHGVPPQLAQVLMYAMAKDPALRYTNAAKLAEALTYFVDQRVLQIVSPPAVPSYLAFIQWLRGQPRVPPQLLPVETAPSNSLPEWSAVPNPFDNYGGAATVERNHPERGLEAMGNRREAAIPNFAAALQSPSVNSTVPQLAAALGPTANTAAGANSTALLQAARQRKSREQAFILSGSIAAVLAIVAIIYFATSSNHGDVAINETGKPAVKENEKTTTTKTPTKTASGNETTLTETEQPPKALIDPGTGKPYTPGKNASAKTTGSGKTGETSSAKTSLVADDGNTLWASPTNGEPLQFSPLPTGAQIFCSLRPWYLLTQTRVGLRVFAAAGPAAAAARQQIETAVGLKFPEIELLQVALADAPAGGLQSVYYVRPRPGMTPERWLAALGNPPAAKLGNQNVYRGSELVYYWPTAENGNQLIAAPPQLLEQMLTSPGFAAPKMERLLKTSDDQRVFNFFCSPNQLFANGGSYFPGQDKLLKTFENLLSYDTDALGLSLHLNGPHFFSELRFRPNASQSAADEAKLYRNKLKLWESDISAIIPALLQQNPQQYASNVLFKFPQRVAAFSKYTRAGEERNMAVLRTYLTADAAEHMILGSELALAYAGMPLDVAG